jgi:hypothetical protein
MNTKSIEKDERTTFIENASYKYGYNFIAFGLLLDVMYKSLRFDESSWDLLALIVISGFVMAIYQYKQKILGKAWLKIIVLTLVAAFVFALLLAFILKKF